VGLHGVAGPTKPTSSRIEWFPGEE